MVDARTVAIAHATHEKIQGPADVALVVVLRTQPMFQESLQGHQIDQVLQVVVVAADGGRTDSKRIPSSTDCCV